jgi:phospholipid/cholesterol/gamma-HCH transport system substrate-binding protein
MRNLSKSMEELRSTLQESRPHLTSIANKADATMSALSNITSDIEQGKGTIGKLLKDEKLYASVTNAVEGVDKALSSITRFRTFLTFQGDYLIDESNAKGSFLVTLQPRPEKYYIIGVTSDPVGSVEITETTINGTTVKEKKIETKLEFIAQFARRFGNSALRIGLTESTFGLGADYFMYNDKLKFILDAWDFG